MRIQHNIMAMNSYRNLGMNNSKLSKNLEKLSSGYRINRAGDDAAGLAISEKMRAQIAGLDQAQKNAQSGINLVQTAEGALTEVHDMLNRMVTLSTQAANGTYTETDREKIQSEINALTEEIDRIADNSNFNGAKLLDGSLSTKGSSSAVDAFSNIKGAMADLKDIDSVSAKSTISAIALTTAGAAAKWENGTTIKMNFSTSDGVAHEIVLTAQLDKDSNTNFVDADGNVVHTVAKAAANTAATVAVSDIADALAEGIKNELGNEYKVTNTSGKLEIEHLPGGADGLNLTSVDIDVTKSDGLTSLVDTASSGTTGILTPDTTNPPTNQIKGENATEGLDLSKAKIYDGETSSAQVDLEDAIFEIAGKKFVFYDKTNDTKNEDLAAALEAIKEAGATVITLAGSTITDGEAQKMINAIERETGLDATLGSVATTNGREVFTEGATGRIVKIENASSTKGNGGMTLQIGSEAVETISVGVESMKAKDLGIKGLSVKDEDAANDAIDKIKNAIETVSVQRGNLGAIQNRLEHTINNLGVMEENIQDAEANIRDTDIADEMMAYTKNNILIQSAQAMLAQANQAPQGVLQLMG